MESLFTDVGETAVFGVLVQTFVDFGDIEKGADGGLVGGLKAEGF